MLKRLIGGLVKGVLVGALLAVVLVKGLGITALGAAVAYPAAVVAGILTALVAGKPIWARGAWIEVVLKGVAGSVLAAGFMFALRRWVHLPLDLSGLGAGVGAAGELAATSLPAVATLLAILFDLDNTGDEPADSRAPADGRQPVRVANQPSEEDLDLENAEEEDLVDHAPRRGRR
jgi:hypothetical protein